MRLHYPSLQSFPVLDVLRLIRSERVGPVTFFDLILQFGSPAAALERLSELASKGGRSKPLKACSKAEAEKEMERVERFGAGFVRFGGPDYPPLLTRTYDPPPLLTVHGKRIDLLKRACFAIVGSRNASTNGGVIARKIAEDLGKHGLTVVSGLARGIDGQAHEGALATGTVGVIAGGIDTIYPPEHKRLFETIREQGLVISEQPFGAEPYARAFPSRNRIIAGMSQGVLIVEATHKSGSLHTARMALQENRDIFAVPGSPLDPRCQGTNGLLKQGAILTESAKDILDNLNLEAPDAVLEAKPAEFQPAPQNFDANQLDEARSSLLSALSSTPVSLDLLLTKLHMPTSLVMRAVLELELAGRLERLPGGRVSLLYSASELPLLEPLA